MLTNTRGWMFGKLPIHGQKTFKKYGAALVFLHRAVIPEGKQMYLFITKEEMDCMEAPVDSLYGPHAFQSRRSDHLERKYKSSPDQSLILLLQWCTLLGRKLC